jgi:hypothetical protein
VIGLKPLQPRLVLIWADGADRGEPLATWCAAEGAWRVESITRAPRPGVCRPTLVLDCGTHVRMAGTAAPREQG